MSSQAIPSIGRRPSPWLWRELGPEELPVVYPIVLVTDGGPDLPEWIELARRWLATETGRATGIVALHTCRGTYVALFLYAAEEGCHLRRLLVRRLRALELGEGGRTTMAALRAAELIARRLRCPEVVIALDDGRADMVLHESLSACGPTLGYRFEGGVWHRAVDGPAGVIAMIPRRQSADLIR